MTISASHNRYVIVLAVLFILWFAVWAVGPVDRHDWLLENVLVAALAPLLVLSYRRFPLSRVSYTLVFVFLCIHEIGAHYTYAQVPYDAWLSGLFGSGLNGLFGWERNHFDRLVHFSYGLLLAYPIREVFCRVAAVRGFWGYFLPLDVTMSTSMLFELFEWLAAELFGGDLGVAYLGTQGDVWDAHKDMGLATCGALIAMLVTSAINAAIQSDFAREWRQSLSVKGRRPLGEVEIVRLLRQRRRRPS